MKKPHTLLPAFVAIVCAIPASIVAIVFLPWSAFAAIAAISSEPKLALFNLVFLIASIFALVNYWRLADLTLKNQSMKFGLLFLLAVVAAIFSIWVAFDAMPIGAALFVVIPIVMATGWLVIIQRNLTKGSKGLTHHSRGTPNGAP